jgi:hypothetical protein
MASSSPIPSVGVRAHAFRTGLGFDVMIICQGFGMAGNRNQQESADALAAPFDCNLRRKRCAGTD